MAHSRGLFYGWVIVFAGLLLTLIIYGIVESFAITFKPIALDFGWDRGAVSMASMINWISFGVASLVCGVLSDRFGSRRVMLAGSILFIAGTLLMSQIRSLWQLYLFFGVIMAVGRAANHVTLTVLVTKWFVRNQGLALAIAQSQNIGLALFAPLCAFLLAGYGWRGTYLWLGLGAALMIPLALLMRDIRPAAAQRSSPRTEPASDRPAQPLPDLTLREALRTKRFWTLSVAAMGCCLAHSDILLHGVSHMTDVGLEAPVAARVVALMAVCAMVGKIATGLLADRIGAKWALAGFLGLQAVMILFFLAAEQAPSFYVWAILFGIGYAGPMPVYAMLFREYFGTRAIGSLLGCFFILSSFGMGAGGLMGGVLHGVFGSYTVPFLISAGGSFVAAFLILSLPSPKRKGKSGSSASRVRMGEVGAV